MVRSRSLRCREPNWTSGFDLFIFLIEPVVTDGREDFEIDLSEVLCQAKDTEPRKSEYPASTSTFLERGARAAASTMLLMAITVIPRAPDTARAWATNCVAWVGEERVIQIKRYDTSP